MKRLFDKWKNLKRSFEEFCDRVRREGVKGALKELLKSLTFDKGIGIYLDREWLLLFVAEVARTPVGNVLVREDIIPIVEQDEGETLDVDRDGRGMPAAVGIPSKDVYYTVDSARATKSKKEKDLLSIIKDNEGEESIAADNLKMTIQQKEVIARVACRSSSVDAIKPYCVKAGYNIAYCEPAGMSALRASYEFAPRPAKTVCQLRILLGPQEGLAALLHGGFILAYEAIAKPDNNAVKRTVRFLQQFAKDHAFCPAIDEVLLMGDNAAVDWLDTEEISDLPSRTCVAKPYGELIAWGLALRLLTKEQNDVNLAVTVRQILPLKEAISKVVRIWELAAVTVLIGFLWFYQDYQRMNLEDSLASFKSRLKSHDKEVVSLKGKALDSRIFELDKNCYKYEKFLEERVSWASILAGTAGLLPEGAMVTKISSSDDFTKNKKKSHGKNKGRRYFELSLTMQARDKSLRARQVDTLIKQMRSSSLISQHFESVKLAGPVDWVTQGGRLREAKLTIICTEA